MNETLLTLIELQSIDTVIIEKNQKIEAIPLRLNVFERSMKEAELMLQKAKERFQSIEKQKREKEIQIEEARERIRKLRQKSADVKSNKEYQAMLKEIEGVEKGITNTENELLDLMEQVEEIKGSIANEEQKLIRERERFNKVQKEIDAEINEISNDIKSLKKGRMALVKRLDDDTYKWYMDLLKSTRGLAVVEAQNEICKGCNLHIPPQLFVEIRLGKEIHTCPQCRRIIYYKHQAETHCCLAAEKS